MNNSTAKLSEAMNKLNNDNEVIEAIEQDNSVILAEQYSVYRNLTITVELVKSLRTMYQHLKSTNTSDLFASIAPAIASIPDSGGIKAILSSTSDNGVYYATELQPTDSVVYKVSFFDYAKHRVNNVNIGNIEAIVHSKVDILILVDTTNQYADLVQIKDGKYVKVTSGKQAQLVQSLGKDTILNYASDLQRKYVNMVANKNVTDSKPFASKQDVFGRKDNNGKMYNKTYAAYVEQESNKRI